MQPATGARGYRRMASTPKTYDQRSTHTTGNDPISGVDPGGTRSTRPGQRDKTAPPDPKPEADQHVSTGDRNPTRESRLPRAPRQP